MIFGIGITDCSNFLSARSHECQYFTKYKIIIIKKKEKKKEYNQKERKKKKKCNNTR